jgi:hypothetical protein
LGSGLTVVRELVEAQSPAVAGKRVRQQFVVMLPLIDR